MVQKKAFPLRWRECNPLGFHAPWSPDTAVRPSSLLVPGIPFRIVVACAPDTATAHPPVHAAFAREIARAAPAPSARALRANRSCFSRPGGHCLSSCPDVSCCVKDHVSTEIGSLRPVAVPAGDPEIWRTARSGTASRVAATLFSSSQVGHAMRKRELDIILRLRPPPLAPRPRDRQVNSRSSEQRPWPMEGSRQTSLFLSASTT